MTSSWNYVTLEAVDELQQGCPCCQYNLWFCRRHKRKGGGGAAVDFAPQASVPDPGRDGASAPSDDHTSGEDVRRWFCSSIWYYKTRCAINDRGRRSGDVVRSRENTRFHARGEFEGGLREEEWEPERLTNGRPDLRSVGRVLSGREGDGGGSKRRGTKGPIQAQLQLPGPETGHTPRLRDLRRLCIGEVETVHEKIQI